MAGCMLDGGTPRAKFPQIYVIVYHKEAFIQEPFLGTTENISHHKEPQRFGKLRSMSHFFLPSLGLGLMEPGITLFRGLMLEGFFSIRPFYHYLGMGGVWTMSFLLSKFGRSMHHPR